MEVWHYQDPTEFLYIQLFLATGQSNSAPQLSPLPQIILLIPSKQNHDQDYRLECQSVLYDQMLHWRGEFCRNQQFTWLKRTKPQESLYRLWQCVLTSLRTR